MVTQMYQYADLTRTYMTCFTPQDNVYFINSYQSFTSNTTLFTNRFNAKWECINGMPNQFKNMPGAITNTDAKNIWDFNMTQQQVRDIWNITE